MRSATLSLIGIRLLAISFVLTVISSSALPFQTLFTDGPRNRVSEFLEFMGGYLGFAVIVALVLWFAAKPLAARVAPGSENLGVDSGVNAKNIMDALIAVLAVSVIVYSAPNVVLQLWQYSIFPDVPEPRVAEIRQAALGRLISSLIELALGALLLVKGHRLTSWLERIRS